MKYAWVIWCLLVLWLLGVGAWTLLRDPDPECKSSYTLRGVPFAIHIHHCTTEE